jgi:hypothetical protein
VILDIWPPDGSLTGSGLPSPSPTQSALPALTDQLGIETFLILLAVLVFCYALGTLVLHIAATARKMYRRKKRQRDHANVDGDYPYDNY